MSIKLIGITGAAGHGKDTIADCLTSANGYHNFSFASPIKQACIAIFGWGREHLHGNLKEVIDPAYGISPREAMQTLGTDWGRCMIHPEIWIKAGTREIQQYNRVVVSDVRFDNEAEAIKSLGGTIIEVYRPGKEAVNPHASEEGIRRDLIDHTIINDGTIDELWEKTKKCLNFT